MSDETEECVRLAVMIERADGARKIGQNLGFAQINYGRLFVRDYWTLFALAREMDCQIGDLAPKDDKAERRQKWDALSRAAEEILQTVRSLPAPLRSVAEARGRGDSWRKIQRANPERLLFSLKDDHAQAMMVVKARSCESLKFVASAENFFVVSAPQRA